MPTYSFKCTKCCLRFEKSLKISEEHKLNCTDCGEPANKLPPTGVGLKFSEPTKIPKEIDLAVGRDADKRREEYAEKKKIKDKIRKESGSHRLSIDLDGNYHPFKMTSDGKEISGKEGADKRFEMLKDYMKIKNDPETKKIMPPIEDLSKSS